MVEDHFAEMNESINTCEGLMHFNDEQADQFYDFSRCSSLIINKREEIDPKIICPSTASPLNSKTSCILSSRSIPDSMIEDEAFTEIPFLDESQTMPLSLVFAP